MLLPHYSDRLHNAFDDRRFVGFVANAGLILLAPSPSISPSLNSSETTSTSAPLPATRTPPTR